MSRMARRALSTEIMRQMPFLCLLLAISTSGTKDYILFIAWHFRKHRFCCFLDSIAFTHVCKKINDTDFEIFIPDVNQK